MPIANGTIRSARFTCLEGSTAVMGLAPIPEVRGSMLYLAIFLVFVSFSRKYVGIVFKHRLPTFPNAQ